MVFRDIKRACPRCGGSFQELRTSLGHRFERCSSCGGNWVDLLTAGEMFDRLQPGLGIPSMDVRNDFDPILRCPTCTRHMAKRRLHRLDLDTCDQHGIWFDGSELEETLYRHALSVIPE